MCDASSDEESPGVVHDRLGRQAGNRGAWRSIYHLNTGRREAERTTLNPNIDPAPTSKMEKEPDEP